jgi:hypothetical protein
VVVDKEGTIVVADTDNHRLRRLTGRHVMTLAGGSEAGTADGEGAGARFKQPRRLALDERGRLLVTDLGREDTLRVVEASLAPPPWMGPVNAAARVVAEVGHYVVAVSRHHHPIRQVEVRGRALPVCEARTGRKLQR